MDRATAVAHSNIAFIKYWGHAEPALRVPANPSISMNLDCLNTVTTVVFDRGLATDEVTVNQVAATAATAKRVTAHLDRVRARAGTEQRARVASRNDFPTGVGLASSASAFAALTLAATSALGMVLKQDDLSAMARLGSGSACRSVPPGFVEWTADKNGEVSFARSVAPPDHWDLCDCIAIVSTTHKKVGSTEGHARAPSSPLYRARVAHATGQVAACRRAILVRDIEALGREMEVDAVAMHAVAMTSHPPIHYWTPSTLRVMRAVVDWRAAGLPVYYTVDAGPNVHCLCESADRDQVAQRLQALAGVVQVLVACPGGGARLVSEHLI
jgi:diphosphomevalonate decarboxylase